MTLTFDLDKKKIHKLLFWGSICIYQASFMFLVEETTKIVCVCGNSDFRHAAVTLTLTQGHPKGEMHKRSTWAIHPVSMKIVHRNVFQICWDNQKSQMHTCVTPVTLTFDPGSINHDGSKFPPLVYLPCIYEFDVLNSFWVRKDDRQTNKQTNRQTNWTDQHTGKIWKI